MEKILSTTELTLVCERKAYEKNNQVFEYFEYYVLVYGVKVPFEVKDRNVVSRQLLKKKVLGKEAAE